jgi:hypothetical protein
MTKAKPELVSTVKIDKGLRTHGSWCHTASSDGFLTLYVLKCPETDTVANDAVNLENDHLVFNTGYRNTPFRLNINNAYEKNEAILNNYPVYTGEETWVNASTPNKFCVYGFFSQYPTV